MKNKAIDNRYSIKITELQEILKKKLFIIGALTIIMTLGIHYIYNFLNEEQYTTSAQVLIDYESFGDFDVNYDSTFKEKYSSSIVESLIFSDKTINRLTGIISEEELKEALDIKSIDSTNLVEVSITRNDYESSFQIVTIVLRSLELEASELINSISIKVVDWPVIDNFKSNRKPYLLIIVGFFNLVLLIILYLKTYLKSLRFMNNRQLSKIVEIPVIGVIPKVND